MAKADRLRESTQIRLPETAVDGVADELVDRFTVTVLHEGDTVRIVGSPVEIKAASNFLARQGVSLA